MDGFEAADLIATYARIAREAGWEGVVVAADKDLLQLVGEGVSVLNPVKNARLDASAVAESFGVPPHRVVDVLGLMGDSVDNIPGVPGVGEKTALAMVASYGDFETILERARRFADFYDARDGLIKALDALGIEEALGDEAARRVCTAAERAAALLPGLRAVEADAAFRERDRAPLRLPRHR